MWVTCAKNCQALPHLRLRIGVLSSAAHPPNKSVVPVRSCLGAWMSGLVFAWLPISRISLWRDERAVKFFERIPENRAEVEKLEVLHRDLPRLDLREPAPRAIPAGELKFRRELVLRPTLAVAHFTDCWTNCVFERIARHPSRWRVESRSLVFASDEVQNAETASARKPACARAGER